MVLNIDAYHKPYKFALVLVERGDRMVTVRGNGLYGDKPFYYRNEPSKYMSKEVWVRHYGLVTGDSFEQGTAYSLHATVQEAKRYTAPSWWQGNKEAKPAFVSQSTLEKILNEKKHSVLVSDE
jgi:hypothetical protein